MAAAPSVAKTLLSQLYDGAKERAKALFGGTPQDAVKLSENAYLEYVRRNMADPAFLESTLTEVGPVHFRTILAEAAGVDADVVWPLPEGFKIG